jgi:hypothetical protein
MKRRHDQLVRRIFEMSPLKRIRTMSVWGKGSRRSAGSMKHAPDQMELVVVGIRNKDLGSSLGSSLLVFAGV